MNIDEVKSIIDAGEYDYYGIRGDAKDLYSIGDVAYQSHSCYTDPVSYLDNEGNECDLPWNAEIDAYDGGLVDGTCAANCSNGDVDRAIRQARCFGHNLVLIASNLATWGEEEGEIILENAIVLAK